MIYEKKVNKFCDVDKEVYWYMDKGVLSSEVNDNNDLIWVYVQMPFGLAFVMTWKVIFFMKTYLDEFDAWTHQIINLQGVFFPQKKRRSDRFGPPFSRFDHFTFSEKKSTWRNQ